MDVKDAILSRRSIFKFKQEPAPSERYVNLLKLVSASSNVINISALEKEILWQIHIPNSIFMLYSLLKGDSPSFQNTTKRNFTNTSRALLPIEGRSHTNQFNARPHSYPYRYDSRL